MSLTKSNTEKKDNKDICPYKAVAHNDIKVRPINDTTKQDEAAVLKKSMPQHMAFIMDGNGRWAQKRLLPRTAGHKEGLKTMKNIAEYALESGARYLSFYAFSTENWQRPKTEVNYLIRLLKKHIPELSVKMKKEKLSLKISGDLDGFDSQLKQILIDSQHPISSLDRGVINICLNYGGRNEIINAANKAIEAGKRVDEKSFASFLFTNDIPDPDIIIRTGGERRLSNFLLYQSAYAELYFCDKLWPDFDKSDFDAAIEDYKNRTRRFGGI